MDVTMFGFHSPALVFQLLFLFPDDYKQFWVKLQFVLSITGPFIMIHDEGASNWKDKLMT